MGRWDPGLGALPHGPELDSLIGTTRSRLDPDVYRLRHYDVEVGTPGSSPESIRGLVEGLAAYDRDDLLVARRRLASARVDGPLGPIRDAFLGSTLVLLGEPSTAFRVLEPIPFERVREPWRSESRWTLFVALVRGGRTARALSTYLALVREAGTLGRRARRLVPGG
jgi:hypothetical protein